MRLNKVFHANSSLLYIFFHLSNELGSIEENILSHLFEVTIDDLRNTRDKQQKEISSLNDQIRGIIKALNNLNTFVLTYNRNE